MAASLVVLDKAAMANQDDLAAQRNDALVQLKKDPNNINLIFAYARLSARSGYYEGAISALESILDKEPNNRQARFELAVAYFALRSFDIANIHFNILLETGRLSDRVEKRINQFQDEIRKRNTPNSFSANISKGIAANTKQIGQTTENEVTSILKGAFFDRRGIDGVHEDFWITEGSGQLTFDFQGLGIESAEIYLRTGPLLSIDHTNNGAKLRPFLEADIDLSDDDETNTTLSAGILIQTPVSKGLRGFNSTKLGYRARSDSNNNGAIGSTLVGLDFSTSKNVRFRASMFGTFDASQDPLYAPSLLGLRISNHIEFESPLNPQSKNWELENYLQYNVSNFSAQQIDKNINIGASLKAHFSEDYYTDFTYSYNQIPPTSLQAEEQSHLFSVLIGREF